MKLGIWSSYYYVLSPEDAILEFAKNGIHYIELSDEHAEVLMKRGNPKETGKAFGEFARQNGVEVLQGHLWLGVRLCTDTENAVSILKDWLDLFDSIGIKAAVLHCDYMLDIPDISKEERFNRNVAVIKQLAEHIEGREISICLENLYCPFLCETVEQLIALVDAIDSERVAICLDTGHLNRSCNRDQAHFIHTAGKLIKALHINDNEGPGPDQHLMPYGRGNVDFKVVMKSLKEIGYDGLCNYEIPGEGSCPLEVKAMKLEYIIKVFDYLDRVTD